MLVQQHLPDMISLYETLGMKGDHWFLNSLSSAPFSFFRIVLFYQALLLLLYISYSKNRFK
jgi:hypothetical protein